MKKPVNLIGLAGPKGSGKSTAAHLLGRLGHEVMTLAGPLKEALKMMCLFEHEQVWGSQEVKERVDERWGFSPRWAMQQLGTELGRQLLGEDHWVKHLGYRMDLMKEDGAEFFVIEDVRFPNEAEFIRSRGGIVVGMVPYEGLPRGGDSHSSEATLREQFPWMVDEVIIQPPVDRLDASTKQSLLEVLVCIRWRITHKNMLCPEDMAHLYVEPGWEHMAKPTHEV